MSKIVLITGASSGIGKALAFEYARHGFDLFLTARDKAHLDTVAADCAAQFKINTNIFVADLSSAESIAALLTAISEINIHTLINNAGFAVKGKFVATDVADELDMLNVQLSAMLKLTKAVLPKMLANGDGRVVNIASVYSFSSVPKQAVYAACKAFMLSFSAALNDELRGSGVKITAVCPGTTRTEFRSRAGITDKENSGMPSEDVAKIAFAASQKGKLIVVPGRWNRLFAVVSKHLPLTLATSLVSFINDRRGVNK